MSYATTEQISERYGADVLLLLADRDRDGAADAAVVEQALADAAAEIDTYLAAKYDLPLTETPDILTRLAVDIAVYRLAAEADLSTDERRKRYEDAVKLLERVARGEASLGLADPPASAYGGVKISRRPRRFSRKTFFSAAEEVIP